MAYSDGYRLFLDRFLYVSMYSSSSSTSPSTSFLFSLLFLPLLFLHGLSYFPFPLCSSSPPLLICYPLSVFVSTVFSDNDRIVANIVPGFYFPASICTPPSLSIFLLFFRSPPPLSLPLAPFFLPIFRILLLSSHLSRPSASSSFLFSHPPLAFFLFSSLSISFSFFLLLPSK